MSRSLQVSDLSFSHSDVVPVVDRVSFQLGPGFTGVIGANGAGKSTLLALLAGILRPTRGTVSAPGPIHLCPQEAALDEPIRAFAWGWVDGAWALQARLGLDPAALDRWTTLSPGERRRWQIGAALAASPATLLLDEPTDHLDADARHWLLDALAGYRGIGVVVSHDRALLDALASGVLRLDHGRLIHTTGGASAALAAWDAERRATVDALDAASAEVRRSRARLADARRTRDAADRMTHASARMKDRHDSDARGVIAGTLAAWGAAAASTGVHRARDRHQTAVAAHDALDRPGLDGGAIAFPSAPGCRPRPIAWSGDLVAGDPTAGGRVLVAGCALVVDRGDRVHLAGPNGAGKTTLLTTALAAAALPPDRVLWLPQELDPDRVAADLETLRDLPRDLKGRVLQAVACLGAAPERLLGTARPSPGEARKLAVALGLGRGAWLIALDEPTNHLDLPSIERLRDALARYDGTLVVVSHDPAFAAAVTTRTVTLG